MKRTIWAIIIYISGLAKLNQNFDLLLFGQQMNEEVRVIRSPDKTKTYFFSKIQSCEENLTKLKYFN